MRGTRLPSPAWLPTKKKVLPMLLAAFITLIMFAFAQSAKAATTEIVNDTLKYATNGEQIWAQGGWMMKEGGTYYWYGLDVSEPMNLPDGTLNPNWKKKISVYTSNDLTNWTAYREVVDFDSINDKLGTDTYVLGQWVGRPFVQYNGVLHKYVMYSEWGANDGNRNSIAIWYSDSPTGPFTYQKKIGKPGGYTMGDLGSIFTDSDGSTYISYTSDCYWSDEKNKYFTNSCLQISKLDTLLNADNDYEIVVTSSIDLQSTAPYKEASFLFKKGSTYYLMASETKSWSSSRTYYYTAPSISGPWTSSYWAGTTPWYGTSYAGTSPTGANSFDTQFDQVFHFQGTQGTVYMFIGDRWSNMKVDGEPASTGPGRNQWYPLTFDSTGKPIINGYHQWYLDTAAGTWSGTAPAVPVDPLLTYALVNGNSGKALGIVNNLTTADALLQQKAYTGAASQSWKFVDAGSGYYNIQNTNSGLYMDIRNASTGNGGYGIQWTASSNTSQQWQLIDAGGGYYKIKNRNSSKVLCMNNGSTDDNALVIQWEETGSTNQTWRFDVVAPH
ncbi:RICIN domain-containing protein [Paenibacillus oryzisoli]|uniref:RICIN domain-containing protein n=1 Tax=Paenibacillus oryzisoli TaxID=1850517 RepID=UPI003D2A70FC